MKICGGTRERISNNNIAEHLSHATSLLSPNVRFAIHKYGDYEKQNSFLKKIQFESPIFALCSKASWDTYNQGGWIILQDLLKNWIAASEVNDPTKNFLTYGFIQGLLN